MSLGPDAAALAAVTTELDRLFAEVAAVSCECGHDDHLFDVIRAADTGEVRALRLGVCIAEGCECRGGRP